MAAHSVTGDHSAMAVHSVSAGRLDMGSGLTDTVDLGHLDMADLDLTDMEVFRRLDMVDLVHLDMDSYNCGTERDMAIHILDSERTEGALS